MTDQKYTHWAKEEEELLLKLLKHKPAFKPSGNPWLDLAG